MLAIARVVDPGDDPVDQVLLLRDLADQMLSSSSPVTAITMSAREMPARSSTQSSDASPYWTCAPAPARPSGSARGRTRSGHLVALLEELAGEVPATLPAPTMITYIRSLIRSGRRHRAAARRGADLALEHLDRDLGRADRVEPCRSYQSARRGSRMRAITVGTLNRRLAICAMTMLVLSPLVAATNTSARSIPAAVERVDLERRADGELTAASSHDASIPSSRRACDSESSSRQETSCPSLSIDRASEEPTRPAPTMRTNMG